jgi:Tol biopolymer transport system component
VLDQAACGFQPLLERQVAHMIADTIYEKLTGVPGAFAASTKAPR